jgi:integrase
VDDPSEREQEHVGASRPVEPIRARDSPLAGFRVYVLGAKARRTGAGARGKRQQSEAAQTFTVENFRGHDLRRTAASIMASGGIPRLTISKILNHVERSITAVYHRHSYDAEKRAALDWWDVKLQALLDNTDRANVLPFAR